MISFIDRPALRALLCLVHLQFCVSFMRRYKNLLSDHIFTKVVTSLWENSVVLRDFESYICRGGKFHLGRDYIAIGRRRKVLSFGVYLITVNCIERIEPMITLRICF